MLMGRARSGSLHDSSPTTPRFIMASSHMICASRTRGSRIIRRGWCSGSSPVVYVCTGSWSKLTLRSCMPNASRCSFRMPASFFLPAGDSSASSTMRSSAASTCLSSSANVMIGGRKSRLSSATTASLSPAPMCDRISFPDTKVGHTTRPVVTVAARFSSSR